MKRRKKTASSYSLIKIMKLFMLSAIPLIVLTVFISIFSIINIRQQNLDSIRNSITLYQKDIAEKIDSIEHFIQWSSVNEPLFTQMEDAQNLETLDRSLRAFRTRVSDSQYSTGAEYQYFLYLQDLDLFCNASVLKSSYQDYLHIHNYILNQISSDTALKKNSTWQSVILNQTPYLFYMITYKGRNFSTFIKVSDLAAPLEQLNFGTHGGLRIRSLNGTVLYDSNSDILKNPDQYRTDSIFYNLLQFHGLENRLPFDLQLYVDNFTMYGRLIVLQNLVLLTALLLCLAAGGFIFSMYRKVIRPIRNFYQNLSKINELDENAVLQSSRIKELEETSLQFRNLIHEIRKLKINIYEAELTEKRFQITFLQNQIRPHFYLNCLTTISSMAQLGNYKDIESMVLFTSRYLRYLFQTDQETVCLKYELSHIQSYLDIQALRYGPIFHYECTVEKGVEEILIPPLLLITFIENSLKHSITDADELQIRLYASKEYCESKPFLKIDISDSGQGFPVDLLAKLIQGETPISENGQHVGIQNNLKRLQLLYGTNYKIEFFNETYGGAHIRLRIPCQFQHPSLNRTPDAAASEKGIPYL